MSEIEPYHDERADIQHAQAVGVTAGALAIRIHRQQIILWILVCVLAILSALALALTVHQLNDKTALVKLQAANAKLAALEAHTDAETALVKSLQNQQKATILVSCLTKPTTA